MRKTAATALAFVCAASVNGQAPNASRQVKSSVETVAADVEVLVLDSKGAPVEGLTKSDFKLFVNGKETPLDYLETPRARATAVADAPLPPSTPPPPASPRRPHSTVLIFDDLHTSHSARQKGISSLRSYLATLAEGEEVAVYSLNFGLRTLQPFTRDRTLIDRALDKAGKTVPLSQIGFPTSEEYLSRSRQTFRSFADLFRALASRPEPKTVVLLAGATPATGETNAGLRSATRRRATGTRSSTRNGTWRTKPSSRGPPSSPSIPRASSLPVWERTLRERNLQEWTLPRQAAHESNPSCISTTPSRSSPTKRAARAWGSRTPTGTGDDPDRELRSRS